MLRFLQVLPIYFIAKDGVYFQWMKIENRRYFYLLGKRLIKECVTGIKIFLVNKKVP